MSHIDLLLRNESAGVYTPQARSDFHIYLCAWQTYTPPDYDCHTYYRNLGINTAETHYQISSGTYNQSPPGYSVESQVDTFWTSPTLSPHTPYVDLWWFDTETSSYTGAAANAATDLAGAQNAVNWTNLYWDSYTSNPIYVGNYGNSTGIRTSGIIVAPFAQTVETYLSLRNDNDVNGQYVAATWDWMGPELYQTRIGEFALGLDWQCSEKARLGITTPLIPFIWLRDSVETYAYMTAQLEYAYSKPECNGLVLWGTFPLAAAPTYYDDKAWMQAALDFAARRNISAGTPF